MKRVPEKVDLRKYMTHAPRFGECLKHVWAAKKLLGGVTYRVCM